MSKIDAFTLLTGGAVVLILVLALLLLAFLIIYLVSLCQLFKKAGKKGWEAIVPFYNTYVLVEIAGLNWWYFLIAILGNINFSLETDGIIWEITNIAGYVVNFFIFYNLAKKMHKNPISTGILGTLFSGIMIPILGLSRSYEYDSSVEVSPNGPIESNNSNYTTTDRFCLGCGQKLKPNSLFCENCGKKVD